MPSAKRKPLEAKTREGLKKKNKKIRESGFVPGVVYGPNRESVPVQFDTQELKSVLRTITPTSLVEVSVDGKVAQTFLTEIQNNPRNHTLLHVSFFEPDPDKHINISIGIQAKGLPLAVKNNLGILFTPIDNVFFRTLPKNAVDFIEVDVSKLAEIGDKIRVSDLDIPEGLELVHEDDQNNVVATITGFQKEVEEETEAEAEEEGDEPGEDGKDAEEGKQEEGPAEGSEKPAKEETSEEK